MLPWNPDRYLGDGKTVNPEWRANMPMNPYRTVDSSSVNLTAFCGTSLNEIDLNIQKRRDEAKFRPWVYGLNGAEELNGYMDNLKAGKQVWAFKSLERGAWARLNYPGSNPPANGTVTSVPQRILWGQEPAVLTFKKPGPVPPGG